VLNETEDTICQLQAALDEEQRMVATLHREKDEVQISAQIWERDLLTLCGDHCHLQASLSRLTLQFTDLQARIQEDHPEFQIINASYYYKTKIISIQHITVSDINTNIAHKSCTSIPILNFSSQNWVQILSAGIRTTFSLRIQTLTTMGRR
jgi:hypothetical protein